MRAMWSMVVVMLVCMPVAGCSYLHYKGEHGELTYLRGAQELNLELEKTEKTFKLKARSDPTPAIELLGRALDKVPIVPIP
jgi:hypothetical protein